MPIVIFISTVSFSVQYLSVRLIDQQTLQLTQCELINTHAAIAFLKTWYSPEGDCKHIVI